MLPPCYDQKASYMFHFRFPRVMWCWNHCLHQEIQAAAGLVDIERTGRNMQPLQYVLPPWTQPSIKKDKWSPMLSPIHFAIMRLQDPRNWYVPTALRLSPSKNTTPGLWIHSAWFCFALPEKDGWKKVLAFYPPGFHLVTLHEKKYT